MPHLIYVNIFFVKHQINKHIKKILFCLMTKRTVKYCQGQKHGEQSAVLNGNNVNEFYNKQVVYSCFPNFL